MPIVLTVWCIYFIFLMHVHESKHLLYLPLSKGYFKPDNKPSKRLIWRTSTLTLVRDNNTSSNEESSFCCQLFLFLLPFLLFSSFILRWPCVVDETLKSKKTIIILFPSVLKGRRGLCVQHTLFTQSFSLTRTLLVVKDWALSECCKSCSNVCWKGGHGHSQCLGCYLKNRTHDR